MHAEALALGALSPTAHRGCHGLSLKTDLDNTGTEAAPSLSPSLSLPGILKLQLLAQKSFKNRSVVRASRSWRVHTDASRSLHTGLPSEGLKVVQFRIRHATQGKLVKSSVS